MLTSHKSVGIIDYSFLKEKKMKKNVTYVSTPHDLSRAIVDRSDEPAHLAWRDSHRPWNLNMNQLELFLSFFKTKEDIFRFEEFITMWENEVSAYKGLIMEGLIDCFVNLLSSEKGEDRQRLIDIGSKLYNEPGSEDCSDKFLRYCGMRHE